MAISLHGNLTARFLVGERPCFALTIHNSQGSTFEEVGIDGNDLRKRLEESTRSNIREYNRLFYVAASRAKKRVLVAWS